MSQTAPADESIEAHVVQFGKLRDRYQPGIAPGAGYAITSYSRGCPADIREVSLPEAWLPIRDGEPLFNSEPIEPVPEGTFAYFAMSKRDRLQRSWVMFARIERMHEGGGNRGRPYLSVRALALPEAHMRWWIFADVLNYLEPVPDYNDEALTLRRERDTVWLQPSEWTRQQLSTDVEAEDGMPVQWLLDKLSHSSRGSLLSQRTGKSQGVYQGEYSVGDVSKLIALTVRDREYSDFSVAVGIRYSKAFWGRYRLTIGYV